MTEKFPDSSAAGPEWRCVRTKTKSEHIAAAHLRQLAGVEVFCPRIRFQRVTRRGKVWFTEALFPGYVMARFELDRQLRAVASANAVTALVRFGEVYPAIDDRVVESLKRELDAEEIVTVGDLLRTGDDVEVVEGPMLGMQAVVTQLLPAKERIKILLDFLGREREIEVPRDVVMGRTNPRTTPTG
ncbi:MAG: transcription termination/antitermination protein NusG [Verrucomicrobiales bacterium]